MTQKNYVDWRKALFNSRILKGMKLLCKDHSPCNAPYKMNWSSHCSIVLLEMHSDTSETDRHHISTLRHEAHLGLPSTLPLENLSPGRPHVWFGELAWNNHRRKVRAWCLMIVSEIALPANSNESSKHNRKYRVCIFIDVREKTTETLTYILGIQCHHWEAWYHFPDKAHNTHVHIWVSLDSPYLQLVGGSNHRSLPLCEPADSSGFSQWQRRFHS